MQGGEKQELTHSERLDYKVLRDKYRDEKTKAKMTPEETARLRHFKKITEEAAADKVVESEHAKQGII